MTSKKRLFLLGALLFLIMNISGIYSLLNEIYDAESNLSTGAVDISLKEYTQNDELYLEEEKKVMPGEEIVLIPKVNNLGIDCYLRAKITYTIKQETFNVTDYIEGDYKNWNKDGDYYYLDSVLVKGEAVELFNKVTIPDLSSEYQNDILILHIVVDAVQAKNFDGDWDNVEIKESIDRTYDIDYSGSSSVVFEDDVNKYINIDDHFFDNLGNMLPGDVTSEEITVYNSSYDKNEYFLSIDYGDLNDLERELLRKITLRIKNSRGEILVQSNLEDKSKHSLGIFSHNEGETLTIELSLPKDLDNEYSKLFAKIIWRFSYDVISHNGKPDNPKTGDFKFDLSITVFILSSIGFLIVLFYERKNTENIEK